KSLARYTHSSSSSSEIRLSKCRNVRPGIFKRDYNNIPSWARINHRRRRTPPKLWSTATTLMIGRKKNKTGRRHSFCPMAPLARLLLLDKHASMFFNVILLQGSLKKVDFCDFSTNFSPKKMF